MRGLTAKTDLIAKSVHRQYSRSFSQFLIHIALVGFGTFLLYSPAYIFRGTLAFENPFVQPMALSEWARALPASLWGGFDRILGANSATFIWALVCATGLFILRKRRTKTIRLAILAITTLVLMALHRVAPPPRLYIIWAPLIMLIQAVGLQRFFVSLIRGITRRLPSSPNTTIRKIVAGFLLVYISVKLLTSTREAIHQSVIVDPEQRPPILLSIEDVITQIALDNADHKHRVIAPLPADLPAIYYREKLGAQIEVNGTPRSNERIWIITRSDGLPEESLTTAS